MGTKSTLASRAALASFTYDFAVSGGTAGAIVIGAGRIPAGAVIFDGLIHVITAVEGTSSTLAVSVVGANDILTATAEASLTIGAFLDTVPDGTAANALLVSAESGCTFTIGVADLTAGKVVVNLRYFDTS
jgi:hypothetical protein